MCVGGAGGWGGGWGGGGGGGGGGQCYYFNFERKYDVLKSESMRFVEQIYKL